MRLWDCGATRLPHATRRCEWPLVTPSCARLRADCRAQKLDVREYVRSLGVGYTFIDVGWWMQLSLPSSSMQAGIVAEFSREVYAGGKKKNALTNLKDIGAYVSRIIADPRTLNQYVFVWQDAKTQVEAMEIGEQVSGEGQKLIDLRKYVHTSLYLYYRRPRLTCPRSQRKKLSLALRRQRHVTQRPISLQTTWSGRGTNISIVYTLEGTTRSKLRRRWVHSMHRSCIRIFRSRSWRRLQKVYIQSQNQRTTS